MKATPFEYRYQTLLHLLVVGLAAFTYVFDRVDLVWAFVRTHSNSATLERVAFGGGALMLLGAAMLETWAVARAHADRVLRLLARILLVLCVGLLLPLTGVVVLLAGEAILIVRLFFNDPERTQAIRR